MNETKFTNGPWRVEEGQDPQICGQKIKSWEIGSDANHFWIAQISRSLCYEQGDANANLIAAAPEMYEVLERIADKLVSEDGVVTGIDAADAVIVLRKARGES